MINQAGEFSEKSVAPPLIIHNYKSISWDRIVILESTELWQPGFFLWNLPL